MYTLTINVDFHLMRAGHACSLVNPPTFFERLGIELTSPCSCLTKTFQKLRINVSIDPNKW